MKAAAKTLWKRHKFMVIGFTLAMAVSIFLLVRLGFNVAYWSQHKNVEIEGWMPLGYIAHSYDVEVEVVLEAVGLDEIPRQRITLDEVARIKGVPVSELEQRLTVVLLEHEKPDQ